MKNSTQVNKDWLLHFFAVTETSVYRVSCDGPAGVLVEKIALRPGCSSKAAIGYKINDGTMLSVGDTLIAFVPEGGGLLAQNVSIERDITKVNTRFWGRSTSPIAALLLSENDAMECAKQTDLTFCDVRWMEKTAEVLRRIGQDHPFFAICPHPSRWLMSPTKWQK